MDLKQVHGKIMGQYTDRYGFITYNPVSYSDPDMGIWDHDNQHLWTGEINLLLRYHGMWEYSKIYEYQYEKFNKAFISTEIVPGLHTRHAPIKLYLFSAGWNAFSLDEHDGIAFSAAALDKPSYINRILNYAEKTDWAFIEHEPYEQGLPTGRKEWAKFLMGLFKIIVFAIRNKDFGGSFKMDQIIFDNPQLVFASRIRLHKDRAFLRVVAGQNPGMFAWLHFLVSSYLTCKKDKKEHSGKNRLFFRLLAFNYCEKVPFGVRWLKRTFVRNMKRQYGEDYMHVIAEKTIRNKNHPLHVLIEGVEL